jgi:hypothetical protein
MAEAGKEEEARRVLRFFARHVNVFSSEVHPLAKLGEALERVQCNSLAALAYTYAYVYTRGRSGWGSFGDEKSRYLMEAALRLNPDFSLQVVSNEIAYRLREHWYSFGVNAELITQVPKWDHNVSHDSLWQAAYDVISKRLPLGTEHGWFARFDPQNLATWSVEEGLIAAAVAGISDPRLFEKIAALTLLFRAVKDRPKSTTAGLRWWLEQKQETTSVLVVLQVLWEAEAQPFSISEALKDLLMVQASSSVWCASLLAQKLLSRAQIEIEARPKPDQAATPPSNLEGRSLLAFADRWGLVEIFLDVWPDFADAVANQLELMLTARKEADKERAIQRHRLNRGREGNANPRVPVLLWEHELFLEALNVVMQRDLSSELWSRGQWHKGVEESILDAVLPAMNVHIGLAISRTYRPNWTRPVEARKGATELSVTESGDPIGRGWLRVAWVEEEYVEDPASRYGPAAEKITVFAGATIKSSLIVSPDDLPFFQAESVDWFSRPGQTGDRVLGWPLMGLARVNDWLGEAFLPVPPGFLLESLKIAKDT